MPRLVHMSWVSSERRWRKMYKGVRYVVSTRELGTEPTQQASLLAANKWWEAKKAEIDVGLAAVQAQEAQAQGRERNWNTLVFQMAQVEAANAQASQHHFAEAASDGKLLDASVRIPPPKSDQPQAPGYAGPVATVGQMVERWVTLEQAKIRIGKVGGIRADMNRICLCHFRDWIGTETPVTAINAAKWLDWFSWLSGRLSSKIWAESHVDRIHAVSKRFVKFLWELELIDLPRNLDRKDLAFTISPKSIVTYTVDELKRFHDAAKGAARLHLLLMANCGMIPKDISDLRHDEVDWDQGIITRKRFKTSKHEGVPVVKYKLWKRTFDLLREHRSKDPVLATVAADGKPWVLFSSDGTGRSDRVASLLRTPRKEAELDKPFKAVRATGASKLGEHPSYRFFSQYYLGQSPRTVADKHYVQPDDAQFFEALEWLEKALDLA